MPHTLATVDVLVAAERLCQEADVSMPRLLIERVLKAHPVKVQIQSKAGRQYSTVVIPDAWLQLQVANQPAISISLELDRGTHEQKRFRQKVRAICAWAMGPYQTAFATDNLTVAFVTQTRRRTEELVTWMKRELATSGKMALSDIFLI